jgi:hypothetical protein
MPLLNLHYQQVMSAFITFNFDGTGCIHKIAPAFLKRSNVICIKGNIKIGQTKKKTYSGTTVP